jgi:hypothetical protein
MYFTVIPHNSSILHEPYAASNSSKDDKWYPETSCNLDQDQSRTKPIFHLFGRRFLTNTLVAPVFRLLCRWCLMLSYWWVRRDYIFSEYLFHLRLSAISSWSVLKQVFTVYRDDIVLTPSKCNISSLSWYCAMNNCLYNSAIHRLPASSKAIYFHSWVCVNKDVNYLNDASQGKLPTCDLYYKKHIHMASVHGHFLFKLDTVIIIQFLIYNI